MTTATPEPVLLLAQQLRRRAAGGIGTYVSGLVQGLATLRDGGQDEAAVTLFAPRHRGSGPDRVARLGAPLRASHLPGPLLTRAWDHGMADVPSGYGVVHAPSLATPPCRRAPLVVTVHDLAWRRVPEAFAPRARAWHEGALARALVRAARFVVDAPPMAQQLVTAGADPGCVTVIPLGCDHLPAPDDGAAAAVLARLGVKGEFLLTVSTLEPRKNLARLFEAYRQARPRLPEPWPLVVVGPVGWGPAVAPVEGVSMAGMVQDAVLAALYGRARLVAYVPVEEGFGLPAVEAMRYGTPVVASPVPSTAGAALEVDPMRIEDIADGLVRVGGNDAVRAALIEAGTRRAAELTWAAAAAGHVALWTSLR